MDGVAVGYVYVTDPVNSFDLDGMGLRSWAKKKAKKSVKIVGDNVGGVIKVVEVISSVPGPVGQIAAAVGTVGYVIQGDCASAALLASSVVVARAFSLRLRSRGAGQQLTPRWVLLLKKWQVTPMMDYEQDSGSEIMGVR